MQVNTDAYTLHECSYQTVITGLGIVVDKCLVCEN